MVLGFHRTVPDPPLPTDSSSSAEPTKDATVISTDSSDSSDKFTVVTGSHFLAATTIVPSVCTLLHLVMKEHVLTNVEHDGLWSIYTRTAMKTNIWSPTCQSGMKRTVHLAGWTLFVSHPSSYSQPHSTGVFMKGHYLLKRWRKENTLEISIRFGVNGFPDGTEHLCMEKKLIGTMMSFRLALLNFQKVLLHLAVVLVDYHERARYKPAENGSDVLWQQKNSTIVKQVMETLEQYEEGLAARLQFQLQEGHISNMNFFWYTGHEIVLSKL
ncbi:hypothetical protein C8R45DRAFT_943855 [Mycena sanguinolenta]|nr:hypothetical protein C8R45DRAFT_943855 [Mycena sanguinolenta]